MYNMGDSSYKLQPKYMTIDTVKNLAIQAKNYCTLKDAKAFHFIFHGGEPLLVKMEYLQKIIDTIKAHLYPEVHPVFSIQTNATLVTDEWALFIKKNKINIGISLDGDKKVNDENRIDHRGFGTYDRVIQGINILKKHEINVSILSVININSDPVEMYNHLKLLEIDSVDFLIPDHNYDNPPQMISHDLSYKRKETPYADWLLKIFDLWFLEEKPIDIRFFRYSLIVFLGGNISFDYIGTDTNDVFVIETNGDIEPVDSLKICGENFTKTGRNVNHTSFAEASKTPIIDLYIHSKNKDKQCQQCQQCPIFEICGGGFIPHRYKSDNGFDNPSIYCSDLIKLFTHIQNKLLNQLEIKDKEKTEYLDTYKIKSVLDTAFA
ncbi:hypothetical protein IW16_17005 [Chryseobacterium vrystaatense]|uniref:Radical SAM core domain-containing protein n=2 Tax=Chryseobacterium vrystaatense TaxID=307480 RepID=A0ABR4UK06_9FLAO|nr:hypothetical protein IW16_17005 [Chryseobacterium vrystaatense]